MDKKYSYEISNPTLGIYCVKDATGNIVGQWRARGANVIPGQINEGAHIHPPCIPGVGPDDGSEAWLTRLAAHAADMFNTAPTPEPPPDAGQPAPETNAPSPEVVATPAVENKVAAEARYLLNNPGTIYHKIDCDKATSGSLKTIAEIASAKPDAKPCTHCNPPALPVAAVERELLLPRGDGNP